MIFEYMFDDAFAVNTRPPTPSRNVRGCFVHTVLMWLLVLFRLSIHRFRQARIADVQASVGCDSAQHPHRHVVPADNVGHGHPPESLRHDPVARHVIQQLVQSDDALHSGQRGTQAAVHPVAQP